MTIFYCAFFTTLAFVIVEKSGAKVEGLNTWNPRKLRPVRDPNRIARSGPLGEIVVTVIFNAWFVGAFWPRPAFDLFGAQFTPAPVWQTIFWSFLALAVANVALAGVNLFRPYWTWPRASLRLLFDGIGGALFCWLLKAQVLAGIGAPGLAVSKAVELTNLINALMSKTLVWAVVTMLVILAFDAYRIIRVRSDHPRESSIGPARARSSRSSAKRELILAPHSSQKLPRYLRQNRSSNRQQQDISGG